MSLGDLGSGRLWAEAIAIVRGWRRRLFGMAAGRVSEAVETRVQIEGDALHARLDDLGERVERRIQIEGEAARAYAAEMMARRGGAAGGLGGQRRDFTIPVASTAGYETALAFQVAGLRRALDAQAREIATLLAKVEALQADRAGASGEAP